MFAVHKVKEFWIYCIIGVLSAACAYLVIGAFATNFGELAPKQKNEIQNTGNTIGDKSNLRNDKMAGKQELLKRSKGKNYW
jgi:hypothetical protein